MARPERQRVLEILENLPEPLWAEVVEFVEFLRWRHGIPETAQLSEPALARAWLTPEEDDAWQSL
ncbi:MAG: DUF2281 domain-containing protein [Actinomycetia bacterium]|nr:DUF2281 domain-containing protein [Actinomycetes bacterium]